MSYLDESGRPDPPPTGRRRHRARQEEAAPQPYPSAERPEYAEWRPRHTGYSGPDHPAPDHPASDHPPLDHPALDHPAPDHPALDHPASGYPDQVEHRYGGDRTGELFTYPTDAGHDGGPAADADQSQDLSQDLSQDPDPDQDDDESDLPVTDRKPGGRAGRNLPAAIGVGLGLGGTVLISLFAWKPSFLVVLVAAAVIGTWEMVRAVRPSGAHPPLIPLLAGGVSMMGLAWFGGADALTLGLMVTLLAVLVWRLGDGPDGYQRDVTMATLIAIYVPFLGAFVALLARPDDDGALRVVITLVAVVLSDTGGYVSGVFLGSHPMAPTVSPKKSWEGFAGSLVWAGVGSALLLYFLLDVALWYGVLFGVLVSASSVLGDLAESLLKRDLGIKDMSNLLPGHGGLMDRLDSILLAAPTAYAVLAFVAPPS